MGGVEELPDANLGRGLESPRRREVIDVEAIALVGRDATGGRVWLGEVALLLEVRHVVAHRGRRDRDCPAAGDVARAHRLGRRDVFLHHRAEDGDFAFVKHGSSLSGYRW